jgi:hypothetical protein
MLWGKGIDFTLITLNIEVGRSRPPTKFKALFKPLLVTPALPECPITYIIVTLYLITLNSDLRTAGSVSSFTYLTLLIIFARDVQGAVTYFGGKAPISSYTTLIIEVGGSRKATKANHFLVTPALLECPVI